MAVFVSSLNSPVMLVATYAARAITPQTDDLLHIFELAASGPNRLESVALLQKKKKKKPTKPEPVDPDFPDIPDTKPPKAKICVRRRIITCDQNECGEIRIPGAVCARTECTYDDGTIDPGVCQWTAFG